MQKLLWRGDGEARREGYLLEGPFLEETGHLFLLLSGHLQCLKTEKVDISKAGKCSQRIGAEPRQANFPHPICHAVGKLQLNSTTCELVRLVMEETDTVLI